MKKSLFIIVILAIIVFALVVLINSPVFGQEEAVKSKVNPLTIGETREKAGEICLGIGPMGHSHAEWYYSPTHEIPIALILNVEESDGWRIVRIFYIDDGTLVLFSDDDDTGTFKNVHIIEMLQMGMDPEWMINRIKEMLKDHLNSLNSKAKGI